LALKRASVIFVEHLFCRVWSPHWKVRNDAWRGHTALVLE
jgi:hypothetical protein